MTDREKYIVACNFAISQLTSKGSCSVVLDVHSDNPTVVRWKDVLEWLDKEYQNVQMCSLLFMQSGNT